MTSNADRQPRPGPAYRIETERLVVRCWAPEDAPALQQALGENLEHLRPWMPWIDQEPELLDAKIERLRGFRGRFDLGQDFTYGIFDLDETRVLGGSGLHTRVGPGALEIGYWIHKDHINRGYATELVAAVTRIGFAVHDIDRLEIRVDPANLASAAVPRKLGYRHEVTRRRILPVRNDERRDLMIWTLLRDELAASPVLARTAGIRAFDAVGRLLRMPP